MHPPSANAWFSWTRLICLVATVALMWVILRKVDFRSLGESVQRLQIGWSLAALAVYGVALTFQAARWHLSLVAVRRGVHAAASWRLAMVGHFFFTVFFGVAGGDAGKSAFYSRWFRLPLAEVLAAAPLDRALSLVGAVVLAVVTWAMAAASGGLDSLGSIPFQRPGFWVTLGIALLAVAVVVLIFWKPAGDGSFARLVRALREGGGRILGSTGLAGRGLVIATAGHLLLSAVFALNLLAVSGSALPWQQLAWTIPAITTISCLPFTVAGAGMREAAAMTLLGLYAVPAADAIVASLLTMIHKLAWAGVGAGVLWREQTLQERVEQLPPSTTVSLLLGSDAPPPASHPQIVEIFVVPDVAAMASLQSAVAQAKGDVIVWGPAAATIAPEVLHRILDALHDSTVVGGISSGRGQQELWGVVSLGWWGRVLRGAMTQGQIDGSQVCFARREALLAAAGEEANSVGRGLSFRPLLNRRGRFIVL